VSVDRPAARGSCTRHIERTGLVVLAPCSVSSYCPNRRDPEGVVVADEHQVPPPVEQSADRIQRRAAEEEFARLPDHETHPSTEPGTGPYGSTATGGSNGPIVLMAVGALITASVFVFRSPWVLVLGIAVFLGAALWAGIANRSPGTMGGSGPSTVEPDEH
jgi:hypothetical protein